MLKKMTVALALAGTTLAAAEEATCTPDVIDANGNFACAFDVPMVESQSTN